MLTFSQSNVKSGTAIVAFRIIQGGHREWVCAKLIVQQEFPDNYFVYGAGSIICRALKSLRLSKDNTSKLFRSDSHYTMSHIQWVSEKISEKLKNMILILFTIIGSAVELSNQKHF